MHLARLGLKRLLLIDRDIVGQENLGHQLLYTLADAQQGLPKSIAASQYVQAVNPAVQTECQPLSLGQQNISAVLAGAELIFDGLDNYYSRMLLNDYALKHQLPLFYAGVVRGELTALAVIPGQTCCLRCYLPELPEPGDVPTCAAEGVFPPLLGVANAIQLDLANTWLSGQRVNSSLFALSLADWRLKQFKQQPRADCAACGQGRYDYLDGLIDPSATRSCHPDRAEAMISTAGLELALLANRLRAAGSFAVRQNKYCVIAAHQEVRYTIFSSGRVVYEGPQGPAALDSFIATYLGV
jgi:adenylyltransferase/sulfurtransferase